MITRIAHVCLFVQDLKRSIDFYTRLGFAVRFRFTRKGRLFGAYLEISNGNFIEIFEDVNIKTPVEQSGHFCLEVEDMDELIEKLMKQGIPLTEKKLGCDDTYQIWLTDPDGNKFEMHEYTSKSSQFTGRDVEADW